MTARRSRVITPVAHYGVPVHRRAVITERQPQCGRTPCELVSFILFGLPARTTRARSGPQCSGQKLVGVFFYVLPERVLHVYAQPRAGPNRRQGGKLTRLPSAVSVARGSVSSASGLQAILGVRSRHTSARRTPNNRISRETLSPKVCVYTGQQLLTHTVDFFFSPRVIPCEFEHRWYSGGPGNN